MCYKLHFIKHYSQLDWCQCGIYSFTRMNTTSSFFFKMRRVVLFTTGYRNTLKLPLNLLYRKNFKFCASVEGTVCGRIISYSWLAFAVPFVLDASFGYS